MVERYAPVSEKNLENHKLQSPVTLTLTPFLFKEVDEDSGSDWLNIHFWCFDRNSKINLCRAKTSPCLCIELEPYCYFQNIPAGGTIHDAQYFQKEDEIYWDEGLANNLFDVMCQKMKKKSKNLPLGFSFNMFNDIYFYTKKKKPYMYIYFKSNKDKYSFKKICTSFNLWFNKDYEYISLTVHEEKVTALRRLMSRQKITYAGWFTVNAVKVEWGSDYRISNENVTEYYIDESSMTEIDPKICATWKVQPRLLGYDLETYSHKGVKRFPNPATPKDAIFICAVDFKIAGIPDSRMKFTLVYGEVDVEQFENAIVFKTEIDLILAYINLVRYLDPDIIMTYNGYRFDEPYIIGRFELYGIEPHNIPNFSRLLNKKTEIYDRKWKSSGRGETITTFIDLDGRANLDCLPNLKAMYKLRMYSLAFASKTFLGNTKLPITVAEMFDAFEASQNNEPDAVKKLTYVAKYGERDTEVTIDLFENRQMWQHIRALSGAGGVSIPDIYLKGEQCRCYSQLYNACMNNGYVLSNSKHFDYYYSGGFVGKPIPGVYEFVFTLDFTSLYPSIIRAYNLCWRTFIPIYLWPTIPKEHCNIINVEQEEPTVHFSISRKTDIESKIKLKNKGYDVEITKEEYEYIDKEHSYVSPIKVKDEDVNDEIPESDPILLDEVPEKTTRYYEFRFIKKEFLEGFLPRLESEWCGTRKVVKNNIKKLSKELDRLESIKFNLLSVKEGFNEELEQKMEDIEIEAEPICESIDEYEQEIKDLKKKYKVQVDIDVEKISSQIEDLENEMSILDIQDKINSLTEKIDELTTEHETLESILKSRNGNDEEMKERLNEINDEIKDIIDDINIYDKAQLAIKIIANSGYGFTGVREGMLSGVFIAICTTYLGRKLIQHANDVLVENYKHLGGEIVYNDTDSSMLKLDITDPYEVEPLGNSMELLINGQEEIRDRSGNIVQEYIEPVFKDPLRMEFEDCCQMCPIKPKFYFKALRNIKKQDIDKFGPFVLDKAGKKVVKKKGVLTAKRGNSVFSMKVYQDLADRVVFLVDIVNSLESLNKHVSKLLNDGYDARELTKVTELGSDYKEEGYYMNVFSKNLAKWGQPVKPGDRIEYIIVQTHEEAAGTSEKLNVGYKCREIKMWEEDENREGIDYEYYVEKGLQKQYDDLFYVGYKKIITDPKMKDIGYNPQSRCHFVHCSTPIKMITAIVKDIMNMKEDKIEKYIREEFNVEYDNTVARNFYAAIVVEYELDKIIDYIKRTIDYKT